ncbi:UNVERIFIED_CONTAM: hypothetical protein Slati_2491500 [Sesamum latifolium]|uniref:Reverse transcriptase/retrotransposon-derived protein RNase H-like domain-containing protein n=1 Tax=Sesamum latifolium TaxID=2727402 RepID=A0AAW2WIP4_9LAMI
MCWEKARGTGPYPKYETDKDKHVKDPSLGSPVKDIPRSSMTEQTEANDPQKGEIRMIAGGPAGGDSQRARKAQVRETYGTAVREVMDIELANDAPLIQFDQKERSGPRTPDNDALVITALLAYYEIECVFIDSGSSADILFGEAYDQMQVGDVPLEAVDTSLKEKNTGGGIGRRNSNKRGKDPIPRPEPKEKALSRFNLWRNSSLSNSYQDLEGIDPVVITHHLNLDPTIKPVKKKKRPFGLEKDKIIQGKVNKLLAAGHIREIQFSEWLSNVVLVPKPGATYQRLVDKNIPTSTGQEHGGVRGRYAHKKEVLRPTQTRGHLGHGTPHQHQRSATTDGENSCTQSIYLKIRRKRPTIFQTLRKVKNFEWTEECQQAFEDLKAYLAKLHLLVKPIPGDTLYLYISSTSQAVSSVLVREEDGTQTPIYYVSKVLNGAESRHPPIEKMALALVITARKLRPLLPFLPCGGQNQHPVEASPRQTRNIRATSKMGDRVE